MHIANQLDTTVMGHPLNAISILLTEIARAVQPIAESVCIFRHSQRYTPNFAFFTEHSTCGNADGACV